MHLLTSKARTVPSRELLTRNFLFLLNCMPVTPLVCSLKVTKQKLLCVFQSFTLESSPPVAMN